MPSKYYNRNFKPQYFYHIFNRGAYKNKIFLDQKDYQTFTSILAYYLLSPRGKHLSYFPRIIKPQSRLQPKPEKPTVHLTTYVLMPNHFHLLLKQLPSATPSTNISNLMRRFIITYAMYFQNKYKHTGAIFQSRYKCVLIDSKEQLLYLSKYIHQNPQKLQSILANHLFSSYPVYINKLETPEWLHPEYILKLTKNYQQFIKQPIQESDLNQFTPLTLE